MAEEKFSTEITNLDDTSVLRVLLHTIHGISPVSTTDFLMVPPESEDAEFSLSYNE